MKAKLIHAALMVSSLFGYLEWGQDSSQFLFQAELHILHLLWSNPNSAIHPFVLLPLFGQIILLATIFQKQPGKVMGYIGLSFIGVLIFFMLFIGIYVPNVKIILSVLPFLICIFVFVKHHRTSYVVR
jgi:hypothetical protein